MAIRIDPERSEVRALRRAADWRGKRVVEIGCGDGRLTLRLAKLGALVDAVDPDRGMLRLARRSLPTRLAQAVHFRRGHAERLPFQDQTFDIAIFAWSL
jgi:ubiquinone/menaquinone biosynthesis C-methylase UbiE